MERPNIDPRRKDKKSKRKSKSFFWHIARVFLVLDVLFYSGTFALALNQKVRLDGQPVGNNVELLLYLFLVLFVCALPAFFAGVIMYLHRD